MRRLKLTHQPGRLRRLGAVLALLGLVFASTLASVSHSMAMPMMAGTVLPDGDQALTGHHTTNAAHDCERDASADTPQQKPPAPCDKGCVQCKDCTMTSFVLTPSVGISGVERYDIHQPAMVRMLAGITPPSPNEPPRV